MAANKTLRDLHLQRGRLLERIAGERAALKRDGQPLRAALQTTDRWLTRAQLAVDYVKRHPSIAVLALAASFVFKRAALWRWSKRGFVVWRLWRSFGDKASALRSR